MPLTPKQKDRAHCLIYDMYVADDKVIRSMAAQELKTLLGITGPVPAHHVSDDKPKPAPYRKPCNCYRYDAIGHSPWCMSLK